MRRLLLLGLALVGVAVACARSLPPARSGAGESAGRPEEGAGVPEGAAPAAPEGPAPAPPASPAPGPAAPEAPIAVRVGLATDLEQVHVPCCREELILGAGGRRWAVRSPLRVLPDPGSSRQGVFRVQVAALKDEGQAALLARRLGERTGHPADAHFDAGVDLYRVRLGRFATREEAETLREDLTGLGLAGVWIVSEGSAVSAPAFLLIRAGEQRHTGGTVRLEGRWLSVASEAGDGVPALGAGPRGGRYRGRLLLYLNDRGRINLINELTVDDYLRSVVPSEMGPEIYDRLEALKAQAVAARTYTLKNLREFTGEGYDICATPRCQVYRGMAAEHPLSDRAVEETARQVLLYRGELVDARYSSACGGHTEDVRVVFPLEDEPYLKGVPCPEAGGQRLGGDLAPGTPFPAGLTHLLLPAPAGGGGERTALQARLEHLASLAGLATPRDHLASLERREVRRFTTSLFDLALDPRLMSPAEEMHSLLGDPPPEWDGDQVRGASLLAQSGVLAGTPRQPVGSGEVEEMLLALAEILGVVREEEAHYRTSGSGELVVRGAGGPVRYPLPRALATFRRQGGGWVAGEVVLVPGDRLRLFFQGGELVALVQDVEAGAGAAELRSRYASWQRFRSDSTLERLVAVRYPGLRFGGLEILSRGVSGRVGRMRLIGQGGGAVEVEGLAVRWTLDLPDTRFTARRVTGEDGRPGWLFTGSGWGHGVGLCQIGSVNLASRGAGYREILEHYYTGVELVRVQPAEERPSEEARSAAPATR